MFAAALRNVTKRFPGIVALEDISLEFHGGEIHVLLGENGAGKSTLMSLLAGMGKPDEGEILIDGKPEVIDSPRRSMDLRIGAVFQQLLLVPSLTVIENLMLGGPWWQPVKRPGAQRRFDELSALLGIAIDADAPVTALSLGEQQQIEIMRALWREEKMLLLDEPTSMLTPLGVRQLGMMLQRLKSQGVALVLITHKLLEAFEFGERISVLRFGKLAGEIGPQRLKTMTEGERTEAVLQMMFGDGAGRPADDGGGVRSVRAPFDGTRPAMLTARSLASAAELGETPLRGVSFDVRRGEVLGIAGVDGNGQKHLAEVLAGQRPVLQGGIELDGREITRGRVPERRRCGVRYVTDDRLGEGIVATFSVATNLVLKEIGGPPYWRRGVSDWALIHRSAREEILRYDIRTVSERTPVGRLSGGNIQKVLLARELDADARVAILNKPTYGLDLKNQRLALERMAAAAARGVALIVISTDLDELLAISHRIGVMFQGRLVGIVDNDADAERAVGRLMTGAAAS